MRVEQIYTSCLAEASYFIESNGIAAVIDPIRDIDVYLQMAEEQNAEIKYVFETHFHADFVSGHLELANTTGATIVYGPNATPDYSFHSAKDNDIFPLGNITLTALHTPGHTMESTTYLLKDEDGVDHSIFTGDTLFIGDVGRPDLAVKSDLTQTDLAGYLYESLHSKILPLDDHVIVYPGHGAGSACGKNMSKETFSTLGVQRKSNYALQQMSKEQFINEVTTGLSKPPKYFFNDVMINKQGYEPLNELISKQLKPLSVDDFEAEIVNGALVLDTRIPDQFENGFIPHAVNIGLNGQYAMWFGELIDLQTPLLLVCNEGKEKEAYTRLARIGVHNLKGYLNGGFDAWKSAGKPLETIESINPDEFMDEMDRAVVLDVRKPGEFTSSHIENAQHLSLSELEEQLSSINKETPYLVHCAGGYRSMIAASLLKRHGFTNFKNVRFGYSKLKHLPELSFVSQSCSSN